MMPLARLATAYPRTALALVFLLTAGFASQLPKLAVDDEIINMIPADHPARLLQERIERDFGVRDLAIVAVANDRGVFNPGSLARVADWTAFFQGLPGVIAEDVASLAATDNIVARGDELVMRPPLPNGGVSPEQARATAREVAGNPLFAGRLVSADGTVAAIYAPLREDATRESVYRAVMDRLASMPAAENGDRILVAGKVMVEGGLGSAMRSDLRRLGPIVVALLVVLMSFYFRHVGLALLPILTAVISVVWTLGLMAALEVPVYVPTTLVPVMLLVIGITEEVHVIGEYRRQSTRLPRRDAVLAALARVQRPLLFMTLTTAVGFASPVASPILPLAYFGLFTAFGIGVAFLLTLSFTPAYLVMIRRPKRWTDWQERGTRMDRGLRALGTSSARHPAFVAVLLTTLAALAVGLALRVKVDENWVNRFKPGHLLQDSDARLNRSLGGTTLLYAQVNVAGDGLKQPPTLARIAALQDDIARLPNVGKVTSIVDLLKRANRVLHGDDARFDRLPATRDAAAQQLLLLESSGDPNDLDSWIDGTASRALIWIQLTDGYASTAAALLPQLEALATRHLGEGVVTFGGPASVNVAMAELVVTSQLRSLIGGLVVEFLVLWLLFRSLRWALLTLVPLAIALPAIFATLTLLGRYVDIPLAVLASIVIGLAVDYAIFLLDRYRHARTAGGDAIAAAGTALAESGTVVVADAAALAAGFCVLALSHFAPLTAIGLLTAGVLIGAALLSLLLPALAQYLPLHRLRQEAVCGS